MANDYYPARLTAWPNMNGIVTAQVHHSIIGYFTIIGCRRWFRRLLDGGVSARHILLRHHHWLLAANAAKHHAAPLLEYAVNGLRHRRKESIVLLLMLR